MYTEESLDRKLFSGYPAPNISITKPQNKNINVNFFYLVSIKQNVEQIERQTKKLILLNAVFIPMNDLSREGAQR